MNIESCRAEVSSRSFSKYTGRVAPVARGELNGDSARRDPDSDRHRAYAHAGLYTSRCRHADVPVSSLDVAA